MDKSDMFELGNKEESFLSEQLSNWKSKVAIVLTAIVVLGIIGKLIQ